MLTISLAQAKFILSGEHFVVDGTPSVVLPAPCFSTQVSIQDQVETGITANCIFDCEQPELQSKKHEYEDFVIEQIKRAARLLCIDLTGCGLKVVVKTTITPGQGAGSSSALSQAIVEAMLKHFMADDFHPNYLRWFGTQLENTWHGPVSGIDNAAIAYKRILFYQRYHRPEPIKTACPLFFVVGTTGPRQSINPYQNMKWLRVNQPLQYAAYRRVMNENAKRLAECITSGDLWGIGECMNESHELFNAAGIVTDTMNHAIKRSRELGALGARMTGAGGGGFVIAFVPVHQTESLQIEWKNLGLKCVRTIQFGLETLANNGMQE